MSPQMLFHRLVVFAEKVMGCGVGRKVVLTTFACLGGFAHGRAADLPRIRTTSIVPAKVEQRGAVYFADFALARYGTLEFALGKVTEEHEVQVRLGEKLGSDGAIDRSPPGSVNYLPTTVRLMPGRNVYKVEIPFREMHRLTGGVLPPKEIGQITPFRYVEIEDLPAGLTVKHVRQIAAAAEFDPLASDFTSSDETLTAVWNLCKHTMQATTPFGLYIDGERERLPYEADAYINQLSHYACDLDPRVARATIDALARRPTWPTEWGFHFIMLVAADYEATGYLAQAEKYYELLRTKLLLDRVDEGGLVRAPAIVDWPPSERDGFDGMPAPENASMVGPLVNAPVNAFYFHALEKMAMLARALGKTGDAEEFEQRAGRAAFAFHQRLFDSIRGVYVDGEGSKHASVHANIFPLAFGLVPKAHVATVANYIEQRGMACSVYAAQYLLEALFYAGRAESAIRLMVSRGRRGWWHMIEQGSTMTLEAWDDGIKDDVTWNHAWGAAPANIISRYLLGVRPDAPAYGRTLIAPRPGALTWAKGKVPTPRGAVGIEYKRDVRGVSLHVTVPNGTRARVDIPVEWHPKGRLRLNGRQVAAHALTDLPAGDYRFDLR